MGPEQQLLLSTGASLVGILLSYAKFESRLEIIKYLAEYKSIKSKIYKIKNERSLVFSVIGLKLSLTNQYSADRFVYHLIFNLLPTTFNGTIEIYIPYPNVYIIPSDIQSYMEFFTEEYIDELEFKILIKPKK